MLGQLKPIVGTSLADRLELRKTKFEHSKPFCLLNTLPHWSVITTVAYVILPEHYSDVCTVVQHSCPDLLLVQSILEVSASCLMIALSGHFFLLSVFVS